MIEATDLRVQYPDGTPVGPFQVRAGPGLSLLVGASGSGKTTLMRTASGALGRVQPARVTGRVRVAGQDPATMDGRRRLASVGHLAQDLRGMAPTPWEEVALPLEHAGTPPRETGHRVAAALFAMDADHLAHRDLTTLSGGEQARVLLAAATACRPRVLLLDEPLAQLDAAGRSSLQEHLAPLLETTTVLASTHRPGSWHLPHQVVRLPTPEPGPSTRLPPAATGETVATSDPYPVPGRDITLARMTVREGEAVAVTGPNGSGKSTLLWALAGLLPTGGTVAVEGTDPATLAAPRRVHAIGFSFQDPSWHITRDTVWEEATVSLGVLGRSPAEAIPWLHRFGLWSLRHRHPWDLSGGQRQRLAMVTALAHRPRLALLDEPTRGMDACHRAAVLASLEERSRDGLATVLVTHDEILAAAMHRTVRIDAPARATAEVAP